MVTSETSTAPITEHEALIDYAGTRYVIVSISDIKHDERPDQWQIFAMRPGGRKVVMGTLFGFDDEGSPRVWIGRDLGLPVRAQDKSADDDSWTKPKRDAAARVMELRDNGWVIAGDERFKTFRTSRHGELNEYWSYNYRAPNGEKFSTIADTLEECRARRDSWLAEHDAEVYYDLKAAEDDAGDNSLNEGSGR